MDELQGLHLINKEGYCHGTIERNFYNQNYHHHIIHYQDLDGKYKVLAMDMEEFNRYSSYAKLKSDRYDIIRNRDIRHIYHFSPIENTGNILKYGLFSREICELLSIPNIITDPNRYDGELGKISASISFPNYKMRYSLEQQRGFSLIIYDINPRLLLSKLDTQFYYTNAANAIFRNINKRTLTTNESFEKMFYESDREPNLPNCFTTDPQAEVLIDTCITDSFIDEVISSSYNEDIKKLCYEKGLNYGVNSSLYGPRWDYRRW